MPDRPTISGYPPALAAAGQPGADGEPPGSGRPVWTVAKRILTGRPVRWGFAAAAVALGGYAVARQWTGVRAALASIGALTVAGAMVSVLIAMFAAMQVWRVLLAALGSPLPIRIGARIMFVGQLGKYLPGSVWPVLAQMELGNAHRVPRRNSASASVLTMLVTILSGLLTALVTLPFVAGLTSYRWAFLAAPALLACLYPKVLNFVLGRLFRLIRRPPLEQPLTARAIATSLAWSFVAWVCYGLQIWLLATRLGAPRGSAVLLALGGFAFAWCVGFLAVFAPAGAGVREVLLVAVLGPVIGVGAGTAVALISRALTTIGDLLAAAIAVVYFRRTHLALPILAAAGNRPARPLL
jgi:glycosyltransferase 2 family protein